MLPSPHKNLQVSIDVQVVSKVLSKSKCVKLDIHDIYRIYTWYIHDISLIYLMYIVVYQWCFWWIVDGLEYVISWFLVYLSQSIIIINHLSSISSISVDGYTIWLWHSQFAMENHHAMKIGKPSISIRAMFNSNFDISWWIYLSIYSLSIIVYHSLSYLNPLIIHISWWIYLADSGFIGIPGGISSSFLVRRPVQAPAPPLAVQRQTGRWCSQSLADLAMLRDDIEMINEMINEMILHDIMYMIIWYTFCFFLVFLLAPFVMIQMPSANRNTKKTKVDSLMWRHDVTWDATE